MDLINKKSNDSDIDNKRKKVFNKKKWREQKYSSKAKVSKWDKAQRRHALRQYNKELKKSGIKFKSKEIEGSKKYHSSLKQAMLKYEKIQEEKRQKKLEKEEIRKRREAALKAYKEKKAIRSQKLFRNGRSGRPSMKGRLELLLEKIESKFGNNGDNT